MRCKAKDSRPLIPFPFDANPCWAASPGSNFTSESIPHETERMNSQTTAALVVLPALTFGLLYFPALRRITPGLSSPYAKASLKRRLLAAGVDASLVLTFLYFSVFSRSSYFVVLGTVFIGFRDALGGRSVGKFFAGLLVVRPETGRSCSIGDSLIRNLFFLFPGANLVAVVLEGITVARDPWGYRLGDRIARTQVVEGFGAKDLAAAFLNWWSRRSVGVQDRRPQSVRIRTRCPATPRVRDPVSHLLEPVRQRCPPVHRLQVPGTHETASPSNQNGVGARAFWASSTLNGTHWRVSARITASAPIFAPARPSSRALTSS